MEFINIFKRMDGIEETDGGGGGGGGGGSGGESFYLTDLS